MSEAIGWFFDSNNTGRWKGPNDSDIERFKKGRYLSLVREVIQNSNDAILNSAAPVRVEFDLIKLKVDDIPDISGLKEKFRQCLPEAQKDTNNEAGQWYLNAISLLEGKSINMLRMADFNTTGMTGPCELGTPYFAYMKAMGTSQKSAENSGGSHGIGKRAPLACSQLRTLFVITKFLNRQGITETLAQGFSALMSHPKVPGSKVGPFIDGEGYWGDPIGAMPVQNTEQLPNWLIREEIGTSIYLMGFDVSRGWEKRLVAITLSNYFAAIYRGKLIVKIGDQLIDSNTIKEIFDQHQELVGVLDDDDEKDRFLGAKNFFDALDDRNPYLFTETSQLQHLGRTSVRVVVREGLPCEYAVLRGGMLITTSLSQLKQFPNYKDFVAVVECHDIEGEKLLRRMEPSRHDDFEPDQFEQERDKKIGRAALKVLQKHIRESIRKHARVASGEAGPVDFMSMFLADETQEGVDSSEVDIDPNGRILITPRKVTPKKYAVQDGGTDGGGSTKGLSSKGTGEPSDGGSNSGDKSGTQGDKMASNDVGIKNARIFKNGKFFKISLTPMDTRMVRLSVYALGQDFEEKILVTKSSIGRVKDGGIDVQLIKGQRFQLDAELGRESLGAYRIYAKEIA